MAQGAAMALNGTLPASLVGRAVPPAFLFASVGILFVSYAFIRLTGYQNDKRSREKNNLYRAPTFEN